MGLFNKLKNVINSIDKEKIEELVDKVEDTIETMADGAKDIVKECAEDIRTSLAQEAITLSAITHVVEEEDYGDNDSVYRVSFCINDSFKEAKSHAAEVNMLHTYSPDEEYGEEGKVPYIAIQNDDDVYCPVEEFKEKGTFDGAIDLTPLGGKFYFKAKKEYYGDIMYFYGLDRLEGFWENNGLCLVYPKSYVGTENETKLMKVLDEVAESYSEEKIK